MKPKRYKKNPPFLKKWLAKHRSWLKSRHNSQNNPTSLNEQSIGAMGGSVCEGDAMATLLDPQWSSGGCGEGSGPSWEGSGVTGVYTDEGMSTILTWAELCNSSASTYVYYDYTGTGWDAWSGLYQLQDLYNWAVYFEDGSSICNCTDQFDDYCGVNYGCMDSAAENYDESANQEFIVMDEEYESQCIEDGNDICECVYQPGCTNPEAENYDPEAIEDDGSCIILGCTDEIAENYNSEATEDDGSCEYIYGCTDDTMYNYDSSATYDDGSCIPIFEGCTDDEAFNYVEEANTDDGSCYYNPGCMDENYLEYDPTADYNNGTCDTPIIEGCMDEDYVEYDDLANVSVPEECITLIILGCTDENYVEYNPDANTSDVSQCETEIIYGCTDEEAFNYNPEATVDDDSCIETIYGCPDPSYIEYDEDVNTDDGSCLELIVEGCTLETIFGFAPTINYDPSANIDDGSCLPIIYGCTDPEAVNFTPITYTINSPVCTDGYVDCDDDGITFEANTDDGSCYYNPGCTDPDYLEYEESYDFNDGSCLTLIVEGCPDPNYLEYNEDVNLDDGSCLTLIVEGCTDSDAFNFDSNANTDDGSCIEVVEGCMDETADNFNQFANVDDPNDCIYLGCTNPEAENHNPQANTDDGSCIILGCTTPQFNEYNPEATEDDGSCETLGLTFLEGTYEYASSQTSLDYTISSPNLNHYDSDGDGSLSDDQNSTTELTLIEVQLDSETSGTIQIYQIVTDFGNQPSCLHVSPITNQSYNFNVGDIDGPLLFNITINGGLYKLGVLGNGFELTPDQGQSSFSPEGMFKGRYNSSNFMSSNIPECELEPKPDDSIFPPDPTSQESCASWAAYFSQFAGGTWYTGTELGDDNLGNYQQAKYCKLCAKIAQGTIPPETLSNAGFNSEYFSIDYCNCCGLEGDDAPKPIPINESIKSRLQKLAGIKKRG